jgi:toxin ParE1/3/4
MARVRKREAARRDPILQRVWYLENANRQVADRFWRAVSDTLKMLAAEPLSGNPVFSGDPRLRGMRRFPVSGGFEKILLFYFPLPDGLELVRVVHGSRDLERLFAEGFFG